MSDKQAAAGIGLATVAAVGAALLWYFRDRLGDVVDDVQEGTESIFERVQEVSQNGELVVDPLTGVFYDDPEQGSMNDEAGDDRNVSFAAANDVLSDVGATIDPRTYLPDVEGDAVAPSTGVLADAGESQNFGEAPEAEDDDLSERAANSNLSDDEKAMYDRLANIDDVDRLDDHQDDSVTESGSNYGTTSGSSSTSFSSGSTSSSSSGSLDSGSDDSDEDLDLSSSDDELTDGDSFTGGLVA